MDDELSELVPVFVGSAYKNMGVQPLLDATNWYLPSPEEVENIALDLAREGREVVVSVDPEAPLVALAFKLEVTPYGQLTYLRIYQGFVSKGTDLVNTRNKKRVRVGRLVRMHAAEMEEIFRADAGDIVALFGVDCFSGDTFTDGRLDYAMTSIFVPEPVVSLAVIPDEQAERAAAEARAELAQLAGAESRLLEVRRGARAEERRAAAARVEAASARVSLAETNLARLESGRQRPVTRDDLERGSPVLRGPVA